MNRIRSFIFPVGRVHKNYKQYIGWSFVSTILVSTETALTTHSMLSAINNDSEFIRTFNYIGKDIIGQIGGLTYMAKMGQKADDNPKRFLLYSNILQQSAYMSISTTPLLPNYFLPIAGLSSILSNISFTGFGAINAKCIQKLAIDNNIGEIYAKISVINTLGSSIGLLIGLCITTLIPNQIVRLSIIPILAFARVFSYNKAINGIL